MISKCFQSKISLNYSQKVATEKNLVSRGYQMGGLGGPEFHENSQYYGFVDPPKILLIDSIASKICLLTLFDCHSNIFYFENI